MEKTYFEDLVNLQKELTNLKATASGYADRYKYSPLDEVLDKVKPICLKNNFVLFSGAKEGKVIVELIHKDGIIREASLQIADYGTDSQKLGSHITYLRRYLISLLLNIATEDDDDGQKTVSANSQNAPKQSEEFNGTAYTRRSGTSKSGKPFDGWFPTDKTKPVYWSDEDYQKAKSDFNLQF